MTWALCLNCGEVKFGAICPCPRCHVDSTGDINLDIAFSDHRIAKETLSELGGVVAAIHEVSADDEICFWAFIRYVSVNHPSILSVDLNPDAEVKCDEVLKQAHLPDVTLRPSPSAEWKAKRKGSGNKRWWQFWKPAPEAEE
ncbi:MAG: hypothetical protein KDA78_04970 [Planctomycetaceae bacterium]|nr:hypothetical protein [Planctomycetaceae bacterium]